MTGPVSLRALSSQPQAPRVPAKDLVLRLRGASEVDSVLETEVFNALTFCMQGDEFGRRARDFRAAGRPAVPDMVANDSRLEQQARLCTGLSSDDHALRSSIALRRASNGDLDSMLAYYEMGPRGVGISSQLEKSLTAEHIHEWASQSVKLLHSSADLGHVDALNALSLMYEPPANPAATPGPSPVTDPTMAYATALAFSWAMEPQVAQHPEIREALQGRAMRLGARLGEEQRRRGEQLAQDLARRCCSLPPR